MSLFIVLDFHISNTEVFLILLTILAFVVMAITAVVFTIRDIIKRKFGAALAIYWLLFAILNFLFWGPDHNDDTWDTPRIALILITVFYFYGYTVFRVIRKRKAKSAVRTNNIIE
jgi:hypothetical protein